ncbi:hypothetical protein [Streptomyces sp. NPDC059389]|uniref:hypothetical protein n=1 Tax=Streptomyces sp. NPDC059389 TaxID=3346818 RepID=UPI0036A44E76
MPVSPNPSASKSKPESASASKSKPEPESGSGSAARPRRPYFELRVGGFEMSLGRRPARLIGWLGSAAVSASGVWVGVNWPF